MTRTVINGKQWVTLPLLYLTAWAFAAEEPKATLTAKVPMRDGVRLATDVYLPEGSTGPLPCILMRTPYGRVRYNREFGSMAQWGYAVVLQDVRGRFDSEGKAMAFAADGWGELQDGHDTVEWLARQPFSNGRVGTVGASAMGITQVLLAPTAPPHLVCQYISVAPASLFHEAIYVGGILRENQAETYLSANAHPDALAEVREHPDYDAYWEAYDAVKAAPRVQVPALHYGGWFDTFSEGTLRNFCSRQDRGGPGARGQQKLVMGPWTHGGPGKKEFGDFELPGPAREVPHNISARRWFDFWLKQESNGLNRVPAVIYYVMGPFDGSSSSGNVWRTAEAWPVPARVTAFYLAPEGRLMKQDCPPSIHRAGFVHDPTDPVPTIGGRNLYLPAGPKDQRALETRPDVLTFTSPALPEDLEVTGSVQAHLSVSTDTRSSSLAARLCDVYPDGRSILIAEGIQRIDSSNDNPPSRIKLTVDLWSTSMVFAKGHRIRLVLSGSNYPRWALVPSQDERAAPPGSSHLARATNRITIWMGSDAESRLELPVVAPVR